MSDLEILKNRAARIILNKPLRSPRSDSLAELWWIVYICKFINGIINHEMNLETQQNKYNTKNKPQTFKSLETLGNKGRATLL